MTNNKKSPSPLLVIVVIAIALIILIPLPAIVLDILITLNLIQAMLILNIALFRKKITDFSLLPTVHLVSTVLPTVHLVSTVFNLALNISSVRLILTKGANFNGLAIWTVAYLVAGSGEIARLIIGCAGFIVFIAVVMLITKGATFVSEVAARFILDGLPIKMMTVDAEHASGSISKEEAQKRKTQILTESDFYGAMVGASEFISGNVKVTIFLIIVIIAGGIAIDTLIRGLTINDAARTYIPLSIGNGILFLLPALLVLSAIRIAITRSIGVEKELN